jgi:site-specific recombinase XerD
VRPSPKPDSANLILAAPVASALKKHHAAQRDEAQESGDAWLDTGLVFVNRDGTPLHSARVTELFARLLREPGCTSACTTSATQALTAGVAMKVVSDMLGHSNTAITSFLYTSVVDEAKRHAANAITAQLGY